MSYFSTVSLLSTLILSLQDSDGYFSHISDFAEQNAGAAPVPRVQWGRGGGLALPEPRLPPLLSCQQPPGAWARLPLSASRLQVRPLLHGGHAPHGLVQPPAAPAAITELLMAVHPAHIDSGNETKRLGIA